MKQWSLNLSDHTGMQIIANNRRIPKQLRQMEGLSTMMLLGYLYAGGSLFSPLGFAYATHWIASYQHHTQPSNESFLIDVHFIDMIAMERLSYLYGQVMHGIFVIMMLTEMYKYHRLFMFVKIIVIFSLLFLNHHLSKPYILSWVFSGVLYFVSDQLLTMNLSYMKALCHIAFHLCLTYNSFLEFEIYKDPNTETFSIVRIVSYCAYLWHAFRVLNNFDSS